MDDTYYMQYALELAAQGRGWVAPNPMVGCVVVKEDALVGEGYHQQYGGKHAEVNALENLGDIAYGATVYVTLEPCCHHGKTPPCTEMLLEKGVRRVVVGCLDPNPEVSGKGIAYLESYGIEVTVGVLESACRTLNQTYMHARHFKRSYVGIKMAMSLDGKIATHTGESKWITSHKSREHSYQLRHQYQAIMVGINTVLCDDPMLDTKSTALHNPVRIVCDTHLNIPLDSKLVLTAQSIPLIIATASSDQEKILALRALGCTLIHVKTHDGMLNLDDVLKHLATHNIESVLVEGGGTLHDSFVRGGWVQKVHAYVAPIIIGGESAISSVSGHGFSSLESAFKMQFTHIQKLGEDLYIEGE